MTIEFTAVCDACGERVHNAALPGWSKLELTAPFASGVLTDGQPGIRVDACSPTCMMHLLERAYAKLFARTIPKPSPPPTPEAIAVTATVVCDTCGGSGSVLYKDDEPGFGRLPCPKGCPPR